MSLASRTYGQGPPIVILHGLFGFSDNWQTIAKALADQYTVITIDQRNHGRSPHLPSHTYHDLSSDLHEFLNENWIFQSIVIGHSMGGKAAMQFALDHPDMVSALVVIDIAPGQSKTRQDDVIAALTTLDLIKNNDRLVIEEQLMASLGDIGTVKFLLKNLTRNPEGQLEWKMNLSVLSAAHDDILAPITGQKYEGPVLFVKGERSGYITDADRMEIERHFPNAQIVTIKDAGHWVHADQPQALLRVLADFFHSIAT
jgi:esterase